MHLLVNHGTVLRWHRRLVTAWLLASGPNPNRTGRPVNAEIAALIERRHREQRLGYQRIQGELLKLGHR